MAADTQKVLRVMLAANIPTKLESLPGAGKTSHINGLFRASGGYLKTMVAVNHDPTDFGGIPKPEVDFYRLLPGEWAVDLTNAANDPNVPVTGLFLDEINTAGRAVLAALLKVVDERIVGFNKLPDSVRMILAMNPAEANGGVDLTPAMANRVAHLHFEYPLKQWAKGISSGQFPDPDPLTLLDEAELQAATAKYSKLVGDFALSGAQYVDVYPNEADARCKAFPTRRTWTMAARAMAATELLGFNKTVMHDAIASLVGKKAADEFEDFADTQGAMDPAAMLADPNDCELPDRDDVLFQALDRATRIALNDPTQERVDAICTILLRVATGDQGTFSPRPGVAAAGMRDVALFLRQHREFIGATVTEAIREFKPIIDAAGGMEA